MRGVLVNIVELLVGRLGIVSPIFSPGILEPNLENSLRQAGCLSQRFQVFGVRILVLLEPSFHLLNLVVLERCSQSLGST